jgi:hypothetical protein
MGKINKIGWEQLGKIENRIGTDKEKTSDGTKKKEKESMRNGV